MSTSMPPSIDVFTMGDIAICPFCNIAFHVDTINQHANEVHFSTNVEETDRLIAQKLQENFRREELQQRIMVAQKPLPTSSDDDALKKKLQDKLRAFRKEEDEEIARKAQEEIDKMNKGRGPTKDYLPSPFPDTLGAMVVPDQWNQEKGGFRLRCEISPTSAEALSVIAHLNIRCPSTVLKRIERIQNPNVWNAFHKEKPHRRFYHGCRTLENENSIIQKGFDVKCCASGGQNFGTWFAYDPNYSLGGFAHIDENGHYHLFICDVVTEKPKLHHPDSMIVVGQSMAYPSYLVVIEFNGHHDHFCMPGIGPIQQKLIMKSLC